MQVLQRVLILSACILAAYAVPHIPTTSFKLSSVIGDASSITKGAEACNKNYTQQQNYINQQIQVQTFDCILQANKTANNSQALLDKQASIVRSNLTTLQLNLANCTAIKDNEIFVTCVIYTNDMNEALLTNANIVAKSVQYQIINDQNQNQMNQKNCINTVMSAAAQNFTIATDNYNRCMQNLFSPSWNQN